MLSDIYIKLIFVSVLEKQWIYSKNKEFTEKTTSDRHKVEMFVIAQRMLKL